MELNITYQGKVATTQDVEFIKRFIAENPNDSRWKFSRRLCEEWNWVQENGALKDMVCRGFMLKLDRAGLIKLPPKKSNPINPLVDRRKPKRVDVDKTPINASLTGIKPIWISEVRKTRFEKVFNGLIEEYHYLGYCHPVGEHLKYMVFMGNRPIACLSWSSAPWHIAPRDNYIGWQKEVRKKNLHFIAYNSRFLIMPFINVKNLASHILGKIACRISEDFQKLYNHPVYFLETFVDKNRFKGTCYKASNWKYLGDTTGRGKNDRNKDPENSIKEILCYPLCRNFKEVMCND